MAGNSGDFHKKREGRGSSRQPQTRFTRSRFADGWGRTGGNKASGDKKHGPVAAALTRSTDPVITVRLRVYGVVQGVGFRPTVARHAASAQVKGSVCNRGPYVEIFAQGPSLRVAYFEQLLEEEPPERAAILKIQRKQMEDPIPYMNFSIIESRKQAGSVYISPDIATCDTCREELFDPSNRRFLHPFINCTCCGPRLTILDALPYDRERTSMKEFAMCPECSKEYSDPKSRRYDAQPVCCNDCGPEVYLLKHSEEGAFEVSDDQQLVCGTDAIRKAQETIIRGGIVAVKGIGGYHLCCNALDEDAVCLLRKRKMRPMKPLAVMMRNLETVKRECIPEEGGPEALAEAEKLLTGHQKPILLLKKRPGGALAPSIAPDNDKVGVMLPYTPVQMLLFEDQYYSADGKHHMPDCLVMTSGNPSGAPICRDDYGAVEELSDLCDEILSHNRKIRIRADDTVMDLYQGKPYMIRRSRGYAPLPFVCSIENSHALLAMGGELKNAFCMGVNGLFYPSPYVGDLDDMRTQEALKETIDRFQTMLEIRPEAVICDLHPRYHSVRIAEEMGLPILQVQHHYAHILSCMAENDYKEDLIGISFDGTGYGDDGTIWGGEILLANLHGYERAAHIRPFLQPGGDASAREGWRIAVSMIHSLYPAKEEALQIIEKLSLSDQKSAAVIFTMSDRRINTILSTSAGRLFDAVSAILGIRRTSTFEGEASCALQYRAQVWAEKQNEEELRQAAALADLSAENSEPSSVLLPTDRLLALLIGLRLKGEEAGKLAWIFHEGLSRMILNTCIQLRQKTGRNTAALSGGCFQNLLLLQLTDEKLGSQGFQVLKHSLIPPNDGGIAIGQALYGAANYLHDIGDV